MDITTAKTILNKYINNGYPDPMAYRKLPRDEFEKCVNIWPVEYLEAVLTYGKACDYLEYFDMEKHGKDTITEWGCKVARTKEVIEFKRTTEGKKKMLRTIAPTKFRTEEKDREELEKDMAIRVEAAGTGLEAKTQTKLNIQRMEHLKALEKSISKGGSLRSAYEDAVEFYNNATENLISNEEALALSERDQKKLSPKSLWLASLVMPLFVFVRTVDIILDSFVLGALRDKYIESKFGGDYPLLEQTIGASFLTAFLSLILAFSEGGATGFASLFFKYFLVCFIPVVIVRNLIGIITELLTIFIGKVIVEPASKCFEAVSQNDYQMFDVSRYKEYADALADQIKEREDIIEDLRTLINEDVPYEYVDEFLKERKDLSLKRLEQDERENEFIKRKMEQERAEAAKKIAESKQ